MTSKPNYRVVENEMSMGELFVQKAIAVLGGIAAGVTAHYLSRAFGLEATLPGSLWATAFTTAMLCNVRFTFK